MCKQKRSVSFATSAVERDTLLDSAHQQMIARTSDEVGTEPSSDTDSDLFGLDWGDDPTIATINSVTERNDRTRWWKGVAGICRFWCG